MVARAISGYAVTAESGFLRALLLATSLVALSAGAAVADETGAAALSDTAYILNLEHLQTPGAGEGAPIGQAWPGFSAVSSPTGVYLPNASAFFNLQGSNDRVTYLTPRMQGIQVSWTGDRSEAAAGASGDRSRSRTYVARPTSVGASFSQGADDFELSFGGDYGTTPKSVPGAVSLGEDENLLRLGAHARISQFTLGGAFGSDIDPDNLGQTLSWDAFGRYDFGALSVGLLYNYMVETDGSSGDAEGVIPGTLQGGVSYFFTPRLAVTTNLAYGTFTDQGGSDEAAISGVLGLSLDF